MTSVVSTNFREIEDGWQTVDGMHRLHPPPHDYPSALVPDAAVLECVQQAVSLQIDPPSSLDRCVEDGVKEPAYCLQTVSVPRLVPVVRVEDALLLLDQESVLMLPWSDSWCDESDAPWQSSDRSRAGPYRRNCPTVPPRADARGWWTTTPGPWDRGASSREPCWWRCGRRCREGRPRMPRP